MNERALTHQSGRGARVTPAPQALLAAIVASSDDAIISKDLDGTVLSWNAGARRLFGYTAQEMIGRSITMIIPPERWDEERSILERLARGERVDHYETVRVAKDGRPIDISLTISPVLDDAGRVVAASKVARDITARKTAEEALLAADRAKNEFLATLAHELRNPLAPIRNAVRVLHLQTHGLHELRPHLELIERQVCQMTRLIEDLLDISRITSNKLALRRERIDLAQVIDAAVETSEPCIQECRAELVISLPPRPVLVEADLTRLAQVVSNLLNNAAKFSRPGGRIWLTGEQVADEAVLRVRDAGEGIPADLLPSIFELFTQGSSAPDRTRTGLGIGLALARRLVELHGGTIAVASPGIGRGSEFTVRLPVGATSPRPAEPPPGMEADLHTAMPLRVLVVDDNRDSAESLKLFLEMAGHEVRTAYDGLMALEAAEAFHPDAAFIDIGLPKLNGYDVARRIRERWAGRVVRLVALTGWGQEEARRNSREAGFDAHLVKPVHPDSLLDLLSSVQPALTA